MINVLLLGKGSDRSRLNHLWPDTFCPRILGNFEVRTFGYRKGVDYVFEIKDTMKYIVETVSKDWKPDFVLLFSAEWLILPMEVENCPIPTVLVVQDWDYWPMHTTYAVQACDLTICQGLESADKIRKLGANSADWCQFFGTLNTDVSTLLPNGKERDIDLFYPGYLKDEISPIRSSWVVRLSKLSRKYNVFVSGDYLHENDYFRLLRRSKLVFTYHRHGEMSPRIIEALSVGALPLDTGKTTERLIGNLPYGKVSENNFESEVAKLLEQPKKILEDATACAKFVLKNFSAKYLLLQLFEKASTVLDKNLPRRKILELSEQQRLLANSKALYAGMHRSSLLSGELHIQTLDIAIAKLEKAVSLNPSPRNLTSLAALTISRIIRSIPAFEKQGNVNKLAMLSEYSLRKAIEINKNYGLAHLHLWLWNKISGDTEKSISHAKTVARYSEIAPEEFDIDCILAVEALPEKSRMSVQKITLDYLLKNSRYNVMDYAHRILVSPRIDMCKKALPDNCVRILSPLCKDERMEAEALLNTAEYANILGNSKLTITCKQNAILLLPTDIVLRCGLIRDLVRNGKSNKAKDLYIETALLVKTVESLKKYSKELSSVALLLSEDSVSPSIADIALLEDEYKRVIALLKQIRETDGDAINQFSKLFSERVCSVTAITQNIQKKIFEEAT